MRRTGCIIRISFRSDLSPKTVMRQLGYSRNEFNLPWSSRPSGLGAATRRWSPTPSCHCLGIWRRWDLSSLQSISLLDILTDRGFGLIRVKKEGPKGFFLSWQGWSKGFAEAKAKAQGKSQEAALSAQGKPRPSQLFHLDLHSISNRFSQLSKIPTVCRAILFFGYFY